MDDDEEEEPKGPTKYEFSEESKLDEDHLFYLQFTNNFISNVSRPRDFDHCTRWLERLAGEPMYGVAAKRNRNMYLAKLLIAMQDNKVKGPFSSFPPDGPLPSAGIAFGLQDPDEMSGGDLLLDEFDRELNMQDYRYESEDGRTFVATCALPNSSGVMAYIGLTFGGGEGLWLNKEGFQVKSAGEEDRLVAVTPKTPVRRQIELIEQHKELVRKGLDQVWKDLPDEAFQFLIDLPISSSDSNLLELGNYKFDKKIVESMADLYPEELINKIQELLVVSKKEIEKRFRTRHDKIVKVLYKEYSAEIERGLREYKEARQEWATVYQVVAELKEVLDEIEAKENAAHAESAVAGNRPTAVLISSLNDAKERTKRQYDLGKDMEAKKIELHKDIHERALFHMHELEKLEGHVGRLTNEICVLRRDSRKKQMVIQSLGLQLNKT